MLLNVGTATETNCTLVGNTFSIKASPIAFDILSAKLYSDPMLAIVRELLTNAYDSHIAAGREDVAIDIEMPTSYTPHMKIRDYGIGLCKDDVLQLYTTFFDSTKSSSNNFTGCFGLGSKTPFAYTSSFSVISYYEGKKYQFVVTKKDGYPSIFCTGEFDTTEPNGLEITIPVQAEDNANFKECLNKYLRYIPEIKLDATGVNINKPKFITKLNNLFIYEPLSKNSWYNNPDSAILIKQGQNVYDVSNYDTYENNKFKLTFLKQLESKLAVVIEVPIGTFGITPSREDLSKDARNDKKLLEVLEKAETDAKILVTDYKSNDEDSILAHLCADAISARYLSDFNENTTGMNVRVQGVDKAVVGKIKSSDCLISRLDYSILSSVKQGYFRQGKSLLILVPEVFKYHAMVKLCNTLMNYSEFKNYDTILTCTMPKKSTYVVEEEQEDGSFKRVLKDSTTTYHTDIPIIDVMRSLYNAVYLLNNIPKYDFNIEITSITRLYKTYTNHTRVINKANIPVVADDSKNFRSKRGKIRLCNTSYLTSHYSYYDINSNNYIEYGREDSINSFNRYNQPNNTLIINKDDMDSFKQVTKAFASVENIAGENIYQEYLSRLAVEAGVQEEFNVREFNTVYVSKSNLKYFKSFPIYRHERFLQYLKVQNFTCNYTALNTGLGTILTEFESVFMKDGLGNELWSKREHDMITKSATYKYIQHLIHILNKKQFRPIDEIVKLQKAFTEFGCPNSLIITNLNRWTNNKVLRPLVKLYADRHYCYSFHSKRNNKYYSNRNEFTKHQKWILLQLLTYGKVKNALL